jgi:pyruvate dehydrogenase E2 component (dihydrolipoamide acetyltransferase)
LEERIDEEAFAAAYASPAVRRFARELGVNLGRVEGTGRKGRILKEDVQAYVKRRLAAAPGAAGGLSLPESPPIDFSRFGEIERRPLSRIQRIAGPRLQRSWITIPHVTQFDEADITDLEAFRKDRAEEAREKGVKLTLLSFVMKACVPALQKYPSVNSSLDAAAEELVLKRYFHIGFAVDTAEGLLVPIIRDVDKKGIYDLAGELAELADRARKGKLKPEEMKGASFTISSLGGLGGTAFTPIINAPEVAILGVSRASWRPVWRDEAFEPRLLLPLSFSYDHRVVDGALAVRFTSYLASVLADLREVLL